MNCRIIAGYFCAPEGKLMKAAATLFFILSVCSAAAFGQAKSYQDEPGMPTFATAFPVENGFINLSKWQPSHRDSYSLLSSGDIGQQQDCRFGHRGPDGPEWSLW